jgi:hypothetical protein
MSSSVIMQVTEISVGTNFRRKYMNLAPIGDLLYEIEVPEDGVTVTEDGKKIYNLEGIRHIVKGAEVALVMDSEKGDF